MKKTQLCVLFALGLFPPLSNAQFFDGQKLYDGLIAYSRAERKAGDIEDVVKASFANGYIMGVADATSTTQWCPPAGVNPSQLAAVVNKYLTDHPEAWKQSGDDIVRKAIRLAFPAPCRR
jgi:hypothetical protein